MTTETLFEDIGYEDVVDNSAATAAEEIRIEEYNNKVRMLILDAKAYEDDYLSKYRQESIDYYEGTIPGPADEGRTQLVSRDARDTVMAVLPSLIRIFTSAEHVVQFAPNSEQTVNSARDATDYVHFVVWEDNPGFMNLYDVLHDALSKQTGVWQWWTENETAVEYRSFSNLTEEQFQGLMMEEPTIEIEDIDIAEDSEDIEAPVINTLKVRFRRSTPVQRVDSVPPEEFRIDRTAKNIKTARLVGRERIVPASDVLEDGYTWEDIEEFLGAQDFFTEEQYVRNPGTQQGVYYDGSEVLYGEYYIRIDKDGDGINELRRIVTIGDERHIIEDEPADYARFAGVCPDPVPHTFAGHSITNQVQDIQKVRTNLIRSALDSLADTLNPRTVFNPMMTEVDDILNTELGAVVRTKGDPMTAVHELTKQFVGGPALEAYALMDQMRASRTGISEASKGLDPKALQSTTLMGVDAIVTGSQERIELVARIIAETGLTDLFKGLLREVVNNPNPRRSIQIKGQWRAFDVSTFDPDMKVRVNPTMGKGSDQMRLQVLMGVLDRQSMIIEKFGPGNPFVTPLEFRNAFVDVLEMNNIRDVGRYMRPITEEMVQQMQNQPKEPDPAAVLAQAEVEKVRADTAKAIANKQFDNDKLAMDDDFRRDQLNVNAALKLEELAANERQAEITRLNEANSRPSRGEGGESSTPAG